MYVLSKTLYTIDFWKAYSMSLLPLVLRNSGKAKKAIIFDCDNTLWKGILGEDGETGIDLSPQSKFGKIFNKVQQLAVWLSRQGVLVGLCSKNNPADVDNVLENHDEMVLRKEDIVIMRVNWEDKASNLRSIAAELNIGLDSLVFVDDSSFEINLIREQLPMVHCLQVPEAIHDYPGALLKMIGRYFYLTGSSADLEKKDQYKVQALRNELKNKFSSIDDYLASIQLEMTVAMNDTANIGRISELTQKTNQFNLTTKRYTEAQMEAFMKNEGTAVFSVSVRDKFGDSGLTAVCIVEFDGVAIVDSFLMSCRVMGRNIEKALMDVVLREAAARGCAKVFAKYVRTPKNESIQTFYDDLGFKCIQSENDANVYELDTHAYVYNNLSYIKINS
jgi:FkbH-like protein